MRKWKRSKLTLSGSPKDDLISIDHGKRLADRFFTMLREWTTRCLSNTTVSWSMGSVTIAHPNRIKWQSLGTVNSAALTRLPIDSSGLFRQAGIWIHIPLQCIWAIQNDLNNISCQLLAANHA
jgi:hypothetical protein